MKLLRTMDSILITYLEDLSYHIVPGDSSSGCSRLISIFFRWLDELQTSKRISTVLPHPLASSKRFITNSTRRIFFSVSWLINSVISMGLPSVIVYGGGLRRVNTLNFMASRASLAICLLQRKMPGVTFSRAGT